MNDDSRPLLPEPPHDPRARQEEAPEPATRKPNWWPLVGVVLVVLAALFGLKTFVMDVPLSPRNATPPPVVVAPTRELTQEELDAKLEVAAMYLGRNQPEGATVILMDTLRGTGCELAYAGWGASNSRKKLKDGHLRFRSEARRSFPDALLSTATVKADLPEAVGGKYVGTGVIVVCP